MGNNPSHQKSSTPSSPSPSSHDSTQQSRQRSHRGDPRNLIHSQRSAASAEPSLAQARGTTSTATHRPRISQSNAGTHLDKPSPGHSTQASPSGSDYHVQIGAELSKEKSAARDIPSKPVDVPVHAQQEVFSEKSLSPPVESGPTVSDMSYHLSRPPRLPLPIAEEVHTPGSPILAPIDTNVPLEDVEALEGEATLPRRSSALSSTTVDEEDAEELKIDKTGLTVPTTFEWREGGERIYVTGSIFDWNTKRRLYKVEGEPGLFRGVVNIRPGTHHVRFLVDNVTKCSTNLPTTVDFGNNLVNYIEVSVDDLPKPSSEAKDDTVPKTTDVKDHAIPATSDTTQPATTSEQETKSKPAPKTKPARPQAKYTSSIPQYLLDLDKEEHTTEYQVAAAAIEKLPSPPSLPGFLGKPILNAATPMKDDNSVLIMPNHTVLNHLATSSIKNNVLAVSATTRYKRKYVTTIMYKPTGADA